MPDKNESEAPKADDTGSAEAAEAAAAAAEARAEAARARANELRRKLEDSRGEAPAAAEVEAVEDSEPVEESEDPEQVAPVAELAPEKNRRSRLPIVAAAVVVLLVVVALLSATGLMLWQHRNVQQQQHRSAEFAAAARQGVVNLMSLDYTHAKETVQRVIDDSTGKFKANFEDGSGDLIKALTDAKVATKVTVNNAAVESMDKDSATVLIAATSQRTGPDAPKEDQQPRVWRVVVSLVREGDQLKMSDVEFV